MKTIRIGNDIRLKITLSSVDQYEETSIKGVKCYLTRVGGECTKKIHNGFPWYISDDYNLNMCGFPSYRVQPANGYMCNTCCAQYNGFGTYPKQVADPHRHFDFLMPTKVLNEKNKVECYFPANEQRYCGVYSLTVVLTMYQYGWGPDNLRTYTVDYGNLFELVDDQTGESGDLSITVDSDGKQEYCTINFAPGFGTGTMEKRKVLKYTEYILPQCSFQAPINYVFDGWMIESDNLNGIYQPGTKVHVLSDMLITAKWNDNTYLNQKIEQFDKEMEKFRLPEGEEFVKIIDNRQKI